MNIMLFVLDGFYDNNIFLMDKLDSIRSTTPSLYIQTKKVYQKT